jgi:hypothetical protein
VEALAAVQQRAAQKREARKTARAVEAVTDPEAAAKRRMEKHKAKRKRRGEEGHRGVIKRGRAVENDSDQGM